MAYDLVTESDDGLKRVQVKSTNRREDSDRYFVRLIRRRYDPESPGNAAGRYRDVAYSEADIDLFFVLTGDGSQYLIPIGAVNGQKALVLDAKYSGYRIE